MANATMLVCDYCGRAPNGDSPDTVMVNPYGCGHDLCSDHMRLRTADGGKPACRVCKATVIPADVAAEFEKVKDRPIVYGKTFDVKHTTHAETILELRLLRNAIHEIVTEPADNLCWLDVYQKLAAMIGVEFDPVRLPREQMKRQCGRFIDSLYDGKPYQTDETTAEILRLLDRLGRIEAMARRHNHPGVNTGAQSLAGAILRIIEEK